MQSVQTLQPDNYAFRMAFAQWCLVKCHTDPFFPVKVLFSDEAFFTREGILNTPKAYMWVEENPHAIGRRAVQNLFSINAWAGIIGDQLLGPYLLTFHLTGCNYFLFLQQVMP